MYGDIRPSVEVDPDTRGGITHKLEHVRKYWHYFS